MTKSTINPALVVGQLRLALECPAGSPTTVPNSVLLGEGVFYVRVPQANTSAFRRILAQVDLETEGPMLSTMVVDWDKLCISNGAFLAQIEHYLSKGKVVVPPDESAVSVGQQVIDLMSVAAEERPKDPLHIVQMRLGLGYAFFKAPHAVTFKVTQLLHSAGIESRVTSDVKPDSYLIETWPTTRTTIDRYLESKHA